ncbi:MAG: NUDIX domain-containing protein [Firmicutes bacterium]|nr:NUDIX domain-containing protein [Bacillota bacterium]
MSKKDIRLMIDDVKFSSRAVGVLKKNNKILFQKRKSDEFWALPGGAIEVFERAKNVITRELEEEIGLTNVKVIRPLWFAEYFFKFDELNQHQYIIGYLLDIEDSNDIINKDVIEGIEEGKNIIYKWMNIDEIKDAKIKPDYLKEKLTNIKNEFEFIEEEDL